MGVNFQGGQSPNHQTYGAGKSAPSFLKRGADAQQAIAEAEARAELAKEQAGKLWRFYIPGNRLGEDFRVTFLDGDLTPEGNLDIPLWEEHFVLWNGTYQNFVKPDDSDGPDPIQQYTGKGASLMGGLTVIDHTEHKGKDGKVYKDRRKLYTPKRKTLHVLTKLAQKRGGLRGWTVDITRTNDDAASVGDMWEFVSRASLQEIADQYGEQTATPANFEEELTYLSRDELIKMGFGVKGGVGGSGVKSSKDYSQEM